MKQPLPGIDHIIVLMFENRSFDNVLGGLYPEKSRDGSYHGLTGDEWNPDPAADGAPVHVWQGPTDYATMVMPYPDPGELYSDMREQIYGADDTGHKTMRGFVANYEKQAASPDGVQPVGRHIMQYYAPGPAGNIPITTALASAYAVSDLWFASGPVQTLANRFFAHCATPSVYTQAGERHAVLNNTDITSRHLDPDGAVTDPPVFRLLDDAARSDGWPWPKRQPWKVYYHDWPLSAFVKYVDDNWSFIDDGRVYRYPEHFARDAAEELPTYCFIEPRYTDYFLGTPNSNHPGGSTLHEEPPPISVYNGERLLRDVYTTLHNAPGDLFARSLLIVIYDEHGGLYDHMAPPSATSPFSAGSVTGYDYSDFGVRVPALFIHPSIQPGTIFRPPSGGPPFDHTSIIATLRDQFGLGGPLTRRDAAAPTLAGLVDPNRPRNPFTPDHLPALPTPPATPPAAAPAAVSSAAPEARRPSAPPRAGSLAAVIDQATRSPRNQERVRNRSQIGG